MAPSHWLRLFRTQSTQTHRSARLAESGPEQAEALRRDQNYSDKAPGTASFLAARGRHRWGRNIVQHALGGARGSSPGRARTIVSQNHVNSELPAWLAALQLLPGAARVDSPLRSFTRQRTDDVQ